MADSPLFSVIIPTHNRVRILPRALQSVLAQTMGDFELIVVDDASTDGTAASVASIEDARVRLLRLDRNVGTSSARNAGIGVARGRFITFLDSDDEAGSGWLAAFAESLGDDDVAITCCGVHWPVVDRDEWTEQLPEDLGPLFGGVVGRFLAGSFAVRRDVLEKAGPYRAELRFGENSELGRRLVAVASKMGLRAASIPVALVRVHKDTPRRPYDRARIQATEIVLRQDADILRRSPKDMADFLSIAGVAAARLGEHRASRRYLFDAWRTQPTQAKRFARFLVSILPFLARAVWGPSADLAEQTHSLQ